MLDVNLKLIQDLCKMEKLSSISESLKKLNLVEGTPSWATSLILIIGELVEAIKENNMRERLAKLEDVSEVRKAVIESLQQENSHIKKELEIVRLAADRNEQKSRSSCLLLHGVEEGENEDTDELVLNALVNKVGIQVQLTDIERTHRIGPRKAQTTRRTKSRPIIIRFASMRKRMEVFSSKKNLKGSDIVLTESLTPYRYELLQKAKEKYGVKTTWTSEGRIFTKSNGVLRLISSATDLV